jgi:propionyl-CoA synthetase
MSFARFSRLVCRHARLLSSAAQPPPDFTAQHSLSISKPEQFWHSQSSAVSWLSRGSSVLDSSNPPFYKWFPGWQMNTCFNALDRHVASGGGSKVAVIYDSPVTNTVLKITYGELLERVSVAAGALQALGIRKGDRVMIYMPMIPEAIVSMLACARLGAVHSVVFGGFAPHELSVRIDDLTPKVVLSASCGIETSTVIEYLPMLQAGIGLSAHKPSDVVVVQRDAKRAALPAGWLDWAAWIKSKGRKTEPVPVNANDALYVLYTSGTTGKPKGVVRDNGGHAVGLTWCFKNILGITAKDTFWAASDIGWVVGHTFIVYGPLLTGCTTVLYEGKPVGTPDAGAFWRVIESHGVNGLYTAPTGLRVIRKNDPNAELMAKRNTSSLRAIFLAGERLDPDTYEWALRHAKVPIIDQWWQTETGWPICSNNLGIQKFAFKAGSATFPLPGFDVQVVDDAGAQVPASSEGNVVVKLPLPPGAMTTLWGNDQRFVSSYMAAFPGYYHTGDGGFFDKDGYIFVMGRTDDVINVAAHRLSTGAMEAAVASHPAIAECAVVAVPDALKGHVPVAFVVLKNGVAVDPQLLAKDVVNIVRAQIGAVASLRLVHVVPALPKTRSGKILRKHMRSIAEGRNDPTPSTIEDASVMHALEPLLRPAKA